MWDYASFSTHLQGLNVEGGIAEPKFRVDGSAFRDGGPCYAMYFLNNKNSKSCNVNRMVPPSN